MRVLHRISWVDHCCQSFTSTACILPVTKRCAHAGARTHTHSKPMQLHFQLNGRNSKFQWSTVCSLSTSLWGHMTARDHMRGETGQHSIWRRFSDTQGFHQTGCYFLWICTLKDVWSLLMSLGDQANNTVKVMIIYFRICFKKTEIFFQNIRQLSGWRWGSQAFFFNKTIKTWSLVGKRTVKTKVVLIYLWKWGLEFHSSLPIPTHALHCYYWEKVGFHKMVKKQSIINE